MPAMDIDQLAEACVYVREAQRRWNFDQADVEDTWAALQAGDAAIDDRLAATGEPVECALRRLRQIASTAILWHDVNGRIALEAVGEALSRLARYCVQRALVEAEQRVAERFGALADTRGRPIRLTVLGMGKLGAAELNFNSDLDLIFIFRGEGQAAGPRRLEARDYLTRVAQTLVAIVDEVTAHGRVWVVDTRLRPFGGAGALVWSAGAMEQYYLSEGRTWERYALIKAATVAGDPSTGADVLDALQPFVYRRYLDYGIFDRLRDLQRRIRQDAGGEPDNIKRGRGGIRELEFMVQSLQLLRGGHHHALRARGFLAALDAGRALGLLDAGQAGQFADDYRFLRTLENRLQAVTGRQTHNLPADPDHRAALVRVMGVSDWAELAQRTDACRQRVHQAFVERFQERSIERGQASGTGWPPDRSGLVDALARSGFADPAAAADRLCGTAARLAVKPLSAEGRRRLDRLMPDLLAEVLALDVPDGALNDLLRLVETVARRSSYLAMLREQPEVLQRLVRVFAASARVAEWIIANPQLLDDLIDPIHGYALTDVPNVIADDPEATLAALVRYRNTGLLRTALAELDGQFDTEQARVQLSRMAERITGAVLQLAAGDAHGPLSIIAYGNLGASRMHYESDLDLVFLHSDEGVPPVRVAQRLINLLQLPGPGGRLYEIDTRLRPNGQAGMLVSTLTGFRRYQHRQAWIWEHQALIRARWIAGDEAMNEVFERVRGEVLAQTRDAAQVLAELGAMRDKQRRGRSESPLQRLQGDIQFIAEAGLLIHAGRQPEITRHRDTRSVLCALDGCGWVGTEEHAALLEAWDGAARQQHLAGLKRDHLPVLDAQLVRRCEAIWNAWFG